MSCLFILLQVYKHKTLIKHGPVRVVLLPQVADLLDIFVKKIRTCLPLPLAFFSDGSMPLFCDDRGQPINHLANTINILWNKAGMLDRFTANKLRKAAVSEVSSYH